jgi:anti-anti-sigma factor
LPAAASPDFEMPPVPQPTAKNATASATPASAIRLNLGGGLGTVELLDCLDAGGIDGEDPVEAGDLEDLGDVAVTADEQQLLEVISQGGKEVIVDFTNTTFIDSTTLGVLVGGVKRLRSNDGQLSLVCSDRNITKIFEITGLDRVFTIYPSREEAVATIGASTQ